MRAVNLLPEQHRRRPAGTHAPKGSAYVVLGVLGVLLVTPAFGIGGRLVDVIEGEPAPEDVKRELRGLNDVPEPVLELLDDLRQIFAAVERPRWPSGNSNWPADASH